MANRLVRELVVVLAASGCASRAMPGDVPSDVGSEGSAAADVISMDVPVDDAPDESAPLDANDRDVSVDACVPITEGSAGDASVEYQVLDHGLCTGFCERLRGCGLLCSSLNPAPAGCTDDSADAFEQCLHGGLRDVFHVPTCPHACPGRFVGATTCEVDDCRTGAQELSCSLSGAGSIGDIFFVPPSACAAVCAD